MGDITELEFQPDRKEYWIAAVKPKTSAIRIYTLHPSLLFDTDFESAVEKIKEIHHKGHAYIESQVSGPGAPKSKLTLDCYLARVQVLSHEEVQKEIDERT